MLEAGFMPGLYEEHHCASLLRFDLSRTPCKKVRAAKVRLYKPKCSVQMRPTRIGIYQLAPANADWTEGASLCAEEAAASCWSHLRNEKTWAGAKGGARKGVDFLTPALDIQTAPDACGQWMEFDIPIFQLSWCSGGSIIPNRIRGFILDPRMKTPNGAIMFIFIRANTPPARGRSW